MKRYLQTLHTRPDAHKKRFALVVSGTITVIIFLIWSFVSFNNAQTIANASDTNSDNLAAVETSNQSDQNAVTPFQDLMSGIGSAVDALKQGLGQVKQAASLVNLNQDYQNVRNDALPNNGN